jgi:cytochrome c oxidase accessory protein FixG
MRKRITNKQKDPDMSLASNQIKRVVAILIWSSLPLLAAANFMWYFVPPEDFFAYLANPAEHMVLIGFLIGIALFLVVDVIFIKENFCVYICPYSRVQSVLYDKDTIMAIYDPHRGGDIYSGHGNDRAKQFTKQKDLLVVEPSAECTTCESCVTVCPTHIDIRKGLQLECINCLECVDACTKVMGALGKPSLVKWSSEKETIAQEGKTDYWRSKTIMYFVALSLVFATLLIMGSKKETMLLNIDKTTRPYKILEDGKTVENDYLMLITNTDAKAHDFYIEIVGNKNIKITRPTEAFHMSAGAKKKTVVVLETKEMLSKDSSKDTPIPVVIKAYATDDKAKITTTEETVFVYPSTSSLKQ